MLLVLANDLPPAVRGRMKLWFVEPRPNVFVSGIKDSVATEVVEYLHKHCPPSSGVMIIKKISFAPGFEIQTIGPTRKEVLELTGLQLMVESLRSL